MVRERQKIPPTDDINPQPGADAPGWAEADSSPEPAAPAAPSNPLADWITLWQSELGALAVDREAQEAAQAMVTLWAGAAQSLAASFAPPNFAPPADEPSGCPRPAEPARPAAAAAASAAGDDPHELARLRARLAELESRIAELERPKHPARRPGRRRPA